MIFRLLNAFDYPGISEEIEIAKGKYELVTNVKQGIIQRKRERQWQTLRKQQKSKSVKKD